MIRLTRNIEHDLKTNQSFAVIVVDKNESQLSDFEAVCTSNNNETMQLTTKYGKINIQNIDGLFSTGEVLLIFSEVSKCQRFYRPEATINTILLTEECDQLCIMCSQPPKNKRYDHFDLYFEAIKLLPLNARLGISGGEPTLLKKNLFKFLEKVYLHRNDINFHILSNCQHFEKDDIKLLSKISHKILWGIPLYSHIPDTHDSIVGKKGSYNNVLKNFNYLVQSGSRVELRTVLMKQNYNDLPQLADLISTHLNWIEVWAIMQLENYGYAKMNWDKIFYDNSINFEKIGFAINTLTAKRLNVSLYNFPLCTVPDFYRQFTTRSISDWKQKYLDDCNGCIEKQYCSGFFEWYNIDKGFSKIGLAT